MNQTDNLAATQESSQSWSVSNNQDGGLKSISRHMEDSVWGTFAAKHSYLGRVKLKSRSVWAVSVYGMLHDSCNSLGLLLYSVWR